MHWGDRYRAKCRRQMDDVTGILGASGATQLLLSGDGATEQVIVSAFFASTADPELVLMLMSRNVTGPVTGGDWIATFGVRLPNLVLRREDYGDVLLGPIYISATAGFTAIAGRRIRYSYEE